MAQLETLEAKMASIEVSLSTTPRRKNGKKGNNGQLIAKASTLGSSSAVNNILATVRSNTLIDTCRELEVLRNALKDKENTIQNLQGQMNCGRLTSPQPFDSSERRGAELRMQTLKQEEESRKSAIKRINLTLEQIDEREPNIDVRIRQAELEYELGREELGLLGVREEMRSLQARLDAKPMPTLYSCVTASGRSSLHCVQIEYDPKSPRFGAGNAEDKIGLYVQWAAEDSGLQKGDRILEVNGKMTFATSKEEMNRLLTVCPSKAEIVVNRVWTTPPTAEDFLRRENLRLMHRISYLEDQVAELLLQKEKSSVPFKLPKYERKQHVDVFQKGSQVTVLTPNMEPPRSESHNLTTVVAINSPAKVRVSPNEPAHLEPASERCRINGGSDAETITTYQSKEYSVPVGPSEKYHELDSYHSFQSRNHNDCEKVRSLSRKYEKDEGSTRSKHDREKEERKIKVSTVKSRATPETVYSLSDLEKSTRKGSGYSSRIVDYSSETSCIQFRSKDRSVKSLDLDRSGDGRWRGEGEQSDGKPTPPKKPIRLSIHRATSLQNVETGYSLHNAIRKMKRSKAPQPPVGTETKINGTEDSPPVNGSRASSRAESWVNHSDSSQSAFRWPGQNQRGRSKINEKWC